MKIKVSKIVCRPLKCAACGGEGYSSNGAPCWPCQGSGKSIPEIGDIIFYRFDDTGVKAKSKVVQVFYGVGENARAVVENGLVLTRYEIEGKE